MEIINFFTWLWSNCYRNFDGNFVEILTEIIEISPFFFYIKLISISWKEWNFGKILLKLSNLHPCPYLYSANSTTFFQLYWATIQSQQIKILFGKSTLSFIEFGQHELFSLAKSKFIWPNKNKKLHSQYKIFLEQNFHLHRNFQSFLLICN